MVRSHSRTIHQSLPFVVVVLVQQFSTISSSRVSCGGFPWLNFSWITILLIQNNYEQYEELNAIIANTKLPLPMMEKLVTKNPLVSPPTPHSSGPGIANIVSTPLSPASNNRTHPPVSPSKNPHPTHPSSTSEVVIYPSSVSLRVCFNMKISVLSRLIAVLEKAFSLSLSLSLSPCLSSRILMDEFTGIEVWEYISLLTTGMSNYFSY